ncbi:hypothetical protein AVEN_127339-1 [Araneus ventricosus]|uniref:Uncharacterized protein n=1 Tax=Araneus ventricosus TaxID=182803 RepID=A0A4Y2HZM2_ARAVE|nr:hypothetical protein AVEN_127339-1 [Araneus ventricosus]
MRIVLLGEKGTRIENSGKTNGGLTRLPASPMASGPLTHKSIWDPRMCMNEREKGKNSFSSKFPVHFLSKIASSFMLNHTTFSVRGREAITTRFLFFLDDPGKKEGLTPLCRKDLVFGGG